VKNFTYIFSKCTNVISWVPTFSPGALGDVNLSDFFNQLTKVPLFDLHLLTQATHCFTLEKISLHDGHGFKADLMVSLNVKDPWRSIVPYVVGIAFQTFCSWENL